LKHSGNQNSMIVQFKFELWTQKTRPRLITCWIKRGWILGL
jgi:hypothetical protein